MDLSAFGQACLGARHQMCFISPCPCSLVSSVLGRPFQRGSIPSVQFADLDPFGRPNRAWGCETSMTLRRNGGHHSCFRFDEVSPLNGTGPFSRLRPCSGHRPFSAKERTLRALKRRAFEDKGAKPQAFKSGNSWPFYQTPIHGLRSRVHPVRPRHGPKDGHGPVPLKGRGQGRDSLCRGRKESWICVKRTDLEWC